MITLAGFAFLPLTRTFYSSVFLCRQFRKIHSAIAKYAEQRTYLQSVSYEDSRLQNYLKELKDQYSNAIHKNNTLYDQVCLENIISLVRDIDILNSEMKELDTFILELKEKNDEMVATAKSEREELEDKLSSLKSAVLQYLIPDQIIDDKDIIMELTPGVGGQEAMLFTKDMFHMYCNFARWKNWSCEIVKYDGTDIGGVRNAHLAVSGKNAYKILKYECGVHRVQRIPKTEKAGRIHTSTMTVAVLPQPSETSCTTELHFSAFTKFLRTWFSNVPVYVDFLIDITINAKDLEIEFKRSGGAGGQHVNTTDSCVRLYHKPTGIIVESQVERNQHRNKILAMKSLRAKLYEIELESIKKETTLNRKLQVGSAGRSEKVRTYNFVQDRITDHRAHISVFGIDSFFKGEEHLNKLIEQLQEWDSINILMQLLEKYKST